MGRKREQGEREGRGNAKVGRRIVIKRGGDWREREEKESEWERGEGTGRGRWREYEGWESEKEECLNEERLERKNRREMTDERKELRTKEAKREAEIAKDDWETRRGWRGGMERRQRRKKGRTEDQGGEVGRNATKRCKGLMAAGKQGRDK